MVTTSSTVISDMSTNSSSSIRLTTFAESEAAGLNGPLLLRSCDWTRGIPSWVIPWPLLAVCSETDAAVASRSRPLPAAGSGENRGMGGRVEAGGNSPRLPVPREEGGGGGKPKARDYCQVPGGANLIT